MIANTETMVRMGELALSSNPGDVLVSIGLGSCIGLALLDSALVVEGSECSFQFMLVPSAAGVDELLTRLGLGE